MDNGDAGENENGDENDQNDENDDSILDSDDSNGISDDSYSPEIDIDLMEDFMDDDLDGSDSDISDLDYAYWFEDFL